MTNFYEILRVSPRATNAEIKSAYRKLARRLHPDRNRGAVDSVREFRKVTQAYEVLGDPKRRAEYDHERLKSEFTNQSSLFTSGNSHAQRMRRMVYEKRYNEIVSRMKDDEQTVSRTVRRFVIPTLTFLVATFLTALVNPDVFVRSGFLGRLLLITLAAAGVIHLIGRMREFIERYAYQDDLLTDSILDDEAGEDGRRFSRFPIFIATGAALVACLFGGLLLGDLLGLRVAGVSSGSLPRDYQPEILLYPPIIAMLFDILVGIGRRLSPTTA